MQFPVVSLSFLLPEGYQTEYVVPKTNVLKPDDPTPTGSGKVQLRSPRQVHPMELEEVLESPEVGGGKARVLTKAKGR